MNKSLKFAMQLLLGIFLITSSSQALAEKLDLSKGTMTLGGAVALGQAVANPAFLGGLGHSGSISFGYFVINRLAVTAGIGATGTFAAGNLMASSNVAAGLLYAFDINSIVSPYLSAAANIGITPGFSWGGSAGTGILIALNQHLAVDLGLKVRYDVTGGTWRNDLLTYGVRGFF